MRGKTMLRKLMACALAIVLLATWPANGAFAQASPKDTPIVVGEGAGRYVEGAAPALTGAFDRAIGEIDAAPWPLTPDQVKDLSFRRRLLELRLLMDVNTYAYDRGRMQGYRLIVDQAYQGVGVYQDVSVIQKLIGAEVSPEVVNQREAEMDEALAPLRDEGIRDEMRGFFADPLEKPRNGGAPRLWDLAEVSADDGYDATGNAALLQAGVVHYLQSTDLGVVDIFDPNQALQFHAVRRQIRAVILLSKMFPDTSAATADVMTPLTDLVDQYGDVTDAYAAYVYLQQVGGDTSAIADKLQREFEKAQLMKAQVVDSHALDPVAIQLSAVRDAHQR
jgi:hypothetical protein